jgi:hypothetical protein
MRSVFDKFRGDAKREQDGVWVDVEEEDVVAEEDLAAWKAAVAEGKASGVLVARAGGHNRRYEIELERLARDIRGSTKKRRELLREAVREAFARSAVVDWCGPAWTDESGAPMPFSADAAAMTLRALPDLYEILARVANDREAFRQKRLEEESKNS